MNLLAGTARVGIALALSACSREVARPAENQASAPVAAPILPGPPAPEAPVPAPDVARGPVRFLAIGGGPTPENNEVSLEQDIDLVRRALPGPGLVLFAGGSNSESVRELDPTPKGDSVKLALGELFAPRSGRQSRYRAPRFSAERATLENVEARLSAAFAQGGEPLLVHVAAHGDQGPDARSNAVALWGGKSLSVAHLAELHEQHQRPLRLVATSCFSGGFAELAFARADAKAARPSPVARCGLFAGTWDRETSGCDPNPDRRAQESYGLHFVLALSGKRKDGTALDLRAADFDHDGKIGLLDAHTWASIEAISFDVPTTTSERWLRHATSSGGAMDAALSPEAAAVTERLGASLGLTSERGAEQRWTALAERINALNDRVDDAEDALAAREAEECTLLLEQWPVLDDPFHPDFESTFDNNRRAIETALTVSAEARARAEQSARTLGLYEQLRVLQLEEARVLRVRRAYETLHRAAALMKRGGASAKYYASLVACERAAP
ncbi:MAG: hypothetical protein ABI895_07035 [Deltaproteobacteria bacterium]